MYSYHYLHVSTHLCSWILIGYSPLSLSIIKDRLVYQQVHTHHDTHNCTRALTNHLSSCLYAYSNAILITQLVLLSSMPACVSLYSHCKAQPGYNVHNSWMSSSMEPTFIPQCLSLIVPILWLRHSSVSSGIIPHYGHLLLTFDGVRCNKSSNLNEGAGNSAILVFQSTHFKWHSAMHAYSSQLIDSHNARHRSQAWTCMRKNAHHLWKLDLMNTVSLAYLLWRWHQSWSLRIHMCI